MPYRNSYMLMDLLFYCTCHSNVLERNRLSITELAFENKTKKLSRKGYGLNRVGEFETLFCAIINTEGAY